MPDKNIIDMELYASIGNQIKMARKTKGISLDTLSELIGGVKTKSTLKRYEDGTSRIEVDILKAICDQIGLNYLDVISNARESLNKSTDEVKPVNIIYDDYFPLHYCTNLSAGSPSELLEAQSVEDNGEGLSFNVYCYNVQPGVNINYANGDNSGTASCPLTSEQQAAQAQSAQQSEPVQQTPVQQEQNTQMVWIASSGNGTKYHSNPNCSRMKNPIQLSIQDAQNQGYGPCSKCY